MPYVLTNNVEISSSPVPDDEWGRGAKPVKSHGSDWGEALILKTGSVSWLQRIGGSGCPRRRARL